MIALASDFDGTLFFEDNRDSISNLDIKSIKQFQTNGSLFGICTGRPYSGIKEYLDNKIDLDFSILSSGALILDSQLNIVYEQCIKESLVKDILKQFSKYLIVIQANGNIYAFFKAISIPISQIVVSSFDEIPKGHFYGLSIITSDETEAQKLKIEILSRYSQVIDVHQNKQYLDIVKKGCSKGNAINYLRKYLLADKIAGIGDSFNDITLLDASDIGFTFKNSPKELKKVADHIVGSVHEAISILERE